MIDIHLTGEVGWGIDNYSVVSLLESAKGDDVTIHLTTGGGDVYEGLEIFNTISSYSGNIQIVLGGLVASMGSYLAMAGDSLPLILENAVLMVHNASSFAFGDYKEHLAIAKVLEKLNKHLAQVLVDKTGIPMKKMLDYFEQETFFFGNEIIDNGFASGLYESKNKKRKDTDKTLDVSPNIQEKEDLKLEYADQIKRKTENVDDKYIEKLVAFFDKSELNTNLHDNLKDDTIKNKLKPRDILMKVTSANGTTPTDLTQSPEFKQALAEGIRQGLLAKNGVGQPPEPQPEPKPAADTSLAANKLSADDLTYVESILNNNKYPTLNKVAIDVLLGRQHIGVLNTTIASIDHITEVTKSANVIGEVAGLPETPGQNILKSDVELNQFKQILLSNIKS